MYHGVTGGDFQLARLADFWRGRSVGALAACAVVGAVAAGAAASHSATGGGPL